MLLSLKSSGVDTNLASLLFMLWPRLEFHRESRGPAPDRYQTVLDTPTSDEECLLLCTRQHRRSPSFREPICADHNNGRVSTHRGALAVKRCEPLPVPRRGENRSPLASLNSRRTREVSTGVAGRAAAQVCDHLQPAAGLRSHEPFARAPEEEALHKVNAQAT